VVRSIKGRPMQLGMNHCLTLILTLCFVSFAVERIPLY
jgi:hypothetical protein